MAAPKKPTDEETTPDETPPEVEAPASITGGDEPEGSHVCAFCTDPAVYKTGRPGISPAYYCTKHGREYGTNEGLVSISA